MRMPIDLPGRELSDVLLALYEEVSGMPPRAPVSVEFGTGGARQERETRTSPSWIKIPPHADDSVLAHELLHVAFMRRGYPSAAVTLNPATWTIEIANLIDDAVVHPLLWRELRARGFDDAPYWQTQMAGLDCATTPEVPLTEHTGMLADAGPGGRTCRGHPRSGGGYPDYAIALAADDSPR